LSVAKTATILINDALAGKLHTEYVSRFLSLLNVLAPGRRVVLSDGSSGMIVETHPGYPLHPVVSNEHGKVLDLSEPSAPTISQIEEESTGNLQ
jgi:hypothetical protein